MPQPAHTDAEFERFGHQQCRGSHEQGIPEPEDADAFKARIQQLIDRYEAQYLPRRQRKVTADQIREVDEGESWFHRHLLPTSASMRRGLLQLTKRCVPPLCHLMASYRPKACTVPNPSGRGRQCSRCLSSIVLVYEE